MGPCGDVGVDHLFRQRAGEQDLDATFQFALGAEIPVVLRTLHGVTESSEPAGNDRDLVDWISVGKGVGNQGMGCLVIRHAFLLIFVNHTPLLLQASSHSFNGFVELFHPHSFFIVAGGKKGSLIDEVGEVGPHEAGGDPGDLLQIYGRIEFDVGDMDLEDRLTATDIGSVHEHVPVKPPRPHQGRIEGFRTIARSEHNHAGVAAKSIHLHEQSVEGLFAFVVTTHHAGTAGFPQGIEFVDEDDAGALGFGLLKHVADAGGTNADKHLHKVAPGEPKEGNTRFPRDGLGQQGLARARRANKQHPLGDVSAEELILLRTPQKVDHLP